MALVIQLTTQSRTGFQRVTAFGGRADQFFDQYGISHTTTSGGIQTVFHRHIVIHHHGGDFDAAFVQQLGSGFEIKNVAGVIFDYQQHAFAAINLHGAFEHFIRRGEVKISPGQAPESMP